MSKLEWTRADPRPSRSAPAFSQIEWISAPNCNTLPFFGVRGWGREYLVIRVIVFHTDLRTPGSSGRGVGSF